MAAQQGVKMDRENAVLDRFSHCRKVVVLLAGLILIAAAWDIISGAFIVPSMVFSGGSMPRLVMFSLVYFIFNVILPCIVIMANLRYPKKHWTPIVGAILSLLIVLAYAILALNIIIICITFATIGTFVISNVMYAALLLLVNFSDLSDPTQIGIAVTMITYRMVIFFLAFYYLVTMRKYFRDEEP